MARGYLLCTVAHTHPSACTETETFLFLVWFMMEDMACARGDAEALE